MVSSRDEQEEVLVDKHDEHDIRGRSVEGGRTDDGDHDGDGDNGASSSSFLSHELIRAESKHFDVRAVTNLRVAGHGLARIGPDVAMCASLTELDLSNNAIEMISGIDSLKSLRTVVLSRNKISKLGCLPRCPSLEHILLQRNRFVDAPSTIAVGLSLLPKLRSLYLRNYDGTDANDCCSYEDYRSRMLAELPELCILDGERLRSTDASVAESMRVIRSIGAVGVGTSCRSGQGDDDGGDNHHPHHNDFRRLLAEGNTMPSVPALDFDAQAVDCDVMPSKESQARLLSLIEDCVDDTKRAAATVISIQQKQRKAAAKKTPR